MGPSIPQEAACFIRPRDEIVLLLKTEKRHRDIPPAAEHRINRTADDKHAGDSPSYRLTRISEVAIGEDGK